MRERCQHLLRAFLKSYLYCEAGNRESLLLPFSYFLGEENQLPVWECWISGMD